jgi:hypothetical protein
VVAVWIYNGDFMSAGAFVSATLALAFSIQSHAQVESRLRPIADATVVRDSSSSNFGSSLTLEVDKSPYKYSYLKFEVQSLSGSIQSARLRLYVTNSSSSGPEVYATSSSWSESLITWSNRPPATSSKIADISSISSGRYIEYNVLSVVKGNGTISFVLKPDSSDGSDFASRETANSPELVIVSSGSVVTPTPTPTPVPPVSSYSDDTHNSLSVSRSVITVNKDFGYTQYSYNAASDGLSLGIDMRNSSFTLANSGNANPTQNYKCDQGSLPTNKYPIMILNAGLH